MQPRIVLVTGASSGIGEKIAQLLVRRGDFPILVARRSEALQRLIRELGTGAAYPCDVTDGDSVRELVEQVKQTWERIGRPDQQPRLRMCSGERWRSR